MSDLETQTQIATEYVLNIANGGIDERYIADDMTNWSFTKGSVPRSIYWPRLKNVKEIFSTPLQMTIEKVIAVPDQVVVQARSWGVLFTGAEYSNDYIFLIEFDDEGRIRSVREYFDVERLRRTFVPALEKYERENAPPTG